MIGTPVMKKLNHWATNWAVSDIIVDIKSPHLSDIKTHKPLHDPMRLDDKKKWKVIEKPLQTMHF